jgi:deoxyhypusine synthase
VLVPNETTPDGAVIVGHDFNKGRDLDAVMGAMLTSGFQATALGQAVEEVNRMVCVCVYDDVGRACVF